jgi:hypothetical protein
MPQLLLLAAAGVGIYAGLRWATRELNRVADAARHAETDLQRAARAREANAPKNLGELEWDAANGVYKPKVSS